MPWEHDDLTGRIIGAAIAVHRDLGPGLLEGTYEECLAAELDFCGIRFEKQVSLPISYREKILTRAYRLDFVVEKSVVLELKADGTYAINTLVIPFEQLDAKFHELYDQRPAKLLFIKAAPNRKYGDIIHAMDVAKGAGVQVIGFTPSEQAAAK